MPSRRRCFESVHKDAIDDDDRATHAARRIAVLLAVVTERAERVEGDGVLPRIAARRTVQAAIVGTPEAVVVGAYVVQAATVLEQDFVVLIDRDNRGIESEIGRGRHDVRRRLRHID